MPPSSNTSHSRRRLGPFLLKMLQSGRIPGLVWHNMEERLFRIPWIDKRSSLGENETNVVLYREWEQYNMRYRPGDPDDWSKWKQTFRSALNKSPDVHAVQELYQLKISKPFRVYKFDESMKLRKSEASMCDIVASDVVPSSQPDTRYPLSMFPSEINIPKVVTEELKSEFVIPPTQDWRQQGHATYNGMTPDTHYTENSPVENVGHSCEFNLDSDDWKDMFHYDSSSMDFESLPSFNTPNISMETDKKPLVDCHLYYCSVLKLKGGICSNDAGLVLGCPSPESGNANSCDLPLSGCQQLQCPRLAEQSDRDLRKETCYFINVILKEMSPGLLLYCNDRKLCAQRLCRARVFAWNSMIGHRIIDRKNVAEHELFNMKAFEAQLLLHKSYPENYSCPSAKVFLTFAEEFDLEKIALKKHLIHVELTYLEAEELLRKERLPEPEILLSSGYERRN